MSSKEHLANQLLGDPFDFEARSRYAELLLQEAAYEQSLVQWLLLAKQQPRTTAPLLGAALCSSRLGRPADADAQLESARQCPDFDAGDPRLLELTVKPRTGGLRVLDGGRPAREELADVIPMAKHAGTRFVDVVGMSELKRLLRVRIIEPFLKPGLFQRFRSKAGGGVLLYGPPGCGKTLIARAIAGECNASFINVGISDVIGAYAGESERNLSLLFEKARSARPSVLFFDELDALAYTRSKAASHARPLVNEFLNQLDGFSSDNDQVLILAATNMPWDVDSAMKRPGRFDRQVFVPPPDAEARAEMFRVKLSGIPVAAVDYAALGKATEKFSGADIDGVIDIAKTAVLGEILDRGEERIIVQKDLLEAISSSEPSTLDWLGTARNIVKYGGRDKAYKDVEKYLKAAKLV